MNGGYIMSDVENLWAEVVTIPAGGAGGCSQHLGPRDCRNHHAGRMDGGEHRLRREHR